MDRDTIIRLAEQAAFHTLVQYDELFRFAALVAAHERERICKEIATLHDSLSLQSLPPGANTTKGLRIKE